MPCSIQQARFTTKYTPVCGHKILIQRRVTRPGCPHRIVVYARKFTCERLVVVLLHVNNKYLGMYEIPCVTKLATIAINTLRPRQNGRRFPDDIFKYIFLNENLWISRKISLKFIPKVPINNIAALVQIMAWRRPGDKPLSEPMLSNSLTHICVTRPQWVNT